MNVNLKSQGVTSVKRIIIKNEGKHIETNTFVLTFNTPIVAKDIKIFYRNIKIELYIPNPLRCFWCQKFNHYEDKCSAPPVCRKCGQEGNHASTCSNPIKCANCGKDHPAYSNQCEVWLITKPLLKKVWDMIRKISGKTKSPSFTHLNHPVAETKSTSKFDIAETLGVTFLNNSCSRNLKKFKKLKQNKKKLNLISSLQILRNIILLLILTNFWMQLNNHCN